MKAVWNNTPPTNSFNNLTSLEVWMCNGLSYVAPTEVLGNLSKLQKLDVRFCDSLGEVFRSRSGSNDREGIVPAYAASEEVILPHLTSMVLVDLPRLRSFWSGSRLPSPEDRSIRGCPLLIKQDMLDDSNANDSEDKDEETSKEDMSNALDASASEDEDEETSKEDNEDEETSKKDMLDASDANDSEDKDEEIPKKVASSRKG